jgi:hypothetical protein
MELSPSTIALLSRLENLAGKNLERRDDLGILLEAGQCDGHREHLESLSFHSKFLVRTFGIMRRIGRQGTGYDRLEMEFGEAVERVRMLAQGLLEAAPASDRTRFGEMYLAMTPQGLENLIGLCGDLVWYKNWLLDRGGEP